ncbi:hypothetical protein [Coralliovum pocilloporae]|uniref:hypothetical protein n=1 Tax=Coralliovum pocilloporae TaxID=3066369 RepID=UPI003307BC66
MERQSIFRCSDIEIVRDVPDAYDLQPERDELEAADESGYFGGNHSFANYQGWPWADARLVLEQEQEFLQRIETAQDPHGELEQIDDERCEDCEISGLDVGIAASVIALSAAGFFTFSSCSGGLLDTNHHEEHALVVLFANKDQVPLLLACAKAAGCGLEKAHDGELILYARVITDMVKFAKEVIMRQAEFDKLNLQRAPTSDRRE